MDVLAGTGWHVTEWVRFVRAGVIELLPEAMEGVAGVLICPRTKGGEQLRTPVSAVVMDAAERLRERGTFSAQTFAMAIKAACRAAGVGEFGPGQFRHSVATWGWVMDDEKSGSRASLLQLLEPVSHFLHLGVAALVL